MKKTRLKINYNTKTANYYKGDILIYYGNYYEGKGKVSSEFVESNPDIFEIIEEKPLFYTEDDDIYVSGDGFGERLYNITNGFINCEGLYKVYNNCVSTCKKYNFKGCEKWTLKESKIAILDGTRKNIIEIEIPEGKELNGISNVTESIKGYSTQRISWKDKQSIKSCKTCLFELHSKINKQCYDCIIDDNIKDGTEVDNWQFKQDLSNTKIWIGDNPKLSELVQKKVFELGYIWAISRVKEVKETDSYALYFSSGEIRLGNCEDSFSLSKMTEITPQDLGIKKEEYEIKLVTEKGEKLYIGDKCYFLDNDSYTTKKPIIIKENTKIIKEYKHFKILQDLEDYLYNLELIKLKQKYNK